MTGQAEQQTLHSRPVEGLVTGQRVHQTLDIGNAEGFVTGAARLAAVAAASVARRKAGRMILR